MKNSVLETTLSLDSFNDFFHSIVVTEDHKPASSFIPPDASSRESIFNFSMISTSVVFSLLDVTISVGPDGFSRKFLKEIAAEILHPL